MSRPASMGVLLLGALVVVDRIEADRAVLEWPDGSLGDVPLVLLPEGVQEGDQLRPRFLRVSDIRSVPGTPTIRMGARIGRRTRAAPEDVSHASR